MALRDVWKKFKETHNFDAQKAGNFDLGPQIDKAEKAGAALQKAIEDAVKQTEVFATSLGEIEKATKAYETVLTGQTGQVVKDFKLAVGMIKTGLVAPLDVVESLAKRHDALKKRLR